MELPGHRCIDILLRFNWLSMKEVGHLDMAVSNHGTLKESASQTVNEWNHSHISMKLLIMRCIRITQVHVKAEKCVKVCNSSLKSIGTNFVRPVLCDDMITIRKMIIWIGSKHLKSIDLNHCVRITDIGVSALCQGSGQLESINLNHSVRITDIGVSALGQGSGQLESINLNHSVRITDIGVSALGQGSGQLESINLNHSVAVAGTLPPYGLF
jgi:Leucine Rich repeat